MRYSQLIRSDKEVYVDGLKLPSPKRERERKGKEREKIEIRIFC